MNRNHIEPTQDLGTLAEDAKAPLATAAEIAENKVVAARERLSAALESGREAWETVQDRAGEGAEAADKVIRAHPYQAIGIAFGVGALLGFLITRRNNS